MKIVGHRLSLFLILLTVATTTGLAEEAERPRISLVLSGGGARGAAHVGVLQVMEELRVPVDYVIGTSMGSIIGGLYASGYSPEEMEQAFVEIDWADAFNDKPKRKDINFRRKEDDRESLFRFELGLKKSGIALPAGLIAGSKLGFILRRMTMHVRDIDDFDLLRIPFRAVAADLETGEMVVIGKGNLADAVRASMSIPGVFTPMIIDGKVLVDGGIARNLPIDVGQEIGGEIIIAVDVGTPPGKLEGHQSLFGVTQRTFSVMSKRSVGRQIGLLAERDVLMVPDLTEISTASFDKLTEAVQRGVAAARAVESELRQYSVSEEEFAAFLAGQRKSTVPVEAPTVTSIEVVGLDRIDPRLVRRRVKIRPGDPLDLDALGADMKRISRIGEFEKLDFSLEPDEGGTRVVINATEKSWGPGYVRMGLELDSTLDGTGEFSILANYRRASINRYGAEWRTLTQVGNVDRLFTEFYQPLGFSTLWFVAPQLDIRREERDLFVIPEATGIGEVALIDSTFRTAGFDLGIQFRHWGEIRAGVVRGNLDAEEVSGDASGRLDAQLGGYRVSMVLDRLDNAFFPRNGGSYSLEAFFSRKDLGADDPYDKLVMTASHTWSRGKSTVLAGFELGTDLGSDIPTYDEFRLGGMLRLSGYERNELQGDAYALGTIGYYWELARLPAILGGGTFAGIAFQAGNAWPEVDSVEFNDLVASGLVFLGAETLAGPLYLGYGRAEDNKETLYLHLGILFR